MRKTGASGKQRCNATLVALALGLWACGAEPSAESTTQVPRATAAAGSISVQAMDGEQPLSGAHVILHATSGIPFASLVTGRDGKVTHPFPASGMVSVIRPTPGNAQRITFSGVTSGDQIVAPLGQDKPTRSTRSVTFTLPEEYNGASFYSVSIGCQSQVVTDWEQPVTLPIPASCSSQNGPLSVVALALGRDGDPLAFSSRFALTPEEVRRHLSIALPPWDTGWAEPQVILENPPPQVSTIGVQLIHVAHDVSFEGPMAVASMAQGDSLSIPFQVVPFGDAMHVVVGQVFGSPRDVQGVSFYFKQLADRVSGRTAVRIDLSAADLGRIASVQLTAADPRRPNIEWIMTGDQKRADGGLLNLTWLEPGQEQWQAESWAIVIDPREGREFQLPALPEPLAHLGPSREAVFERPTLAFVDADHLRSYDDLKKRFGPALFSQSGLASGSLRVRLTLGGRIPTP